MEGGSHTSRSTRDRLGDDAEAILAGAARDVIDDHGGAGIDVPADGEARREHYIHCHCRRLAGFDFDEPSWARRHGASEPFRVRA